MPQPVTFAFENLNLFHNPFGELDWEDRAVIACVDLEPIVAHLKSPQAVIQIVGPCGHGKSTRLHAIRRAIPDSSYTYLPEDEHVSLPPLDVPLVIIDESQRFSRRQRGRLFRSSAKLVLATHEDHLPELQKCGRDVMNIRLGHEVPVQHLQSIFNRRIEFARRGPGRVPQIKQSTVNKLQAKHGSNIRSMEQELFEIFQSLAEPADV